jgi:hypothetical protein
MAFELHDIGIGARVKHPTLGIGVVYDIDPHTVHVFFREHGETPIARSFEGLETMAPGPEMGTSEAPLDMEAVKQALEEVLEEVNGPARPIAIARKWEGGTLLMKPANASLQTKELPIDTFFHKVTMVRDRLRVMEQKINAHPTLSPAEKADLQQYITRCYGSFTTFNVLFSEKEDQFAGEKGDRGEEG